MVDFFGNTLAQQSQLAAVVPGFTCKHRSLASQRRRARQNVLRRTHCAAEAVKTQDLGRQAPTWKSSFRERYALGRHIGSGRCDNFRVCLLFLSGYQCSLMSLMTGRYRTGQFHPAALPWSVLLVCQRGLTALKVFQKEKLCPFWSVAFDRLNENLGSYFSNIQETENTLLSCPQLWSGARLH